MSAFSSTNLKLSKIMNMKIIIICLKIFQEVCASVFQQSQRRSIPHSYEATAFSELALLSTKTGNTGNS